MSIYEDEPVYCDHYWIENSGKGGEPRFIENRQFAYEPVMHVLCNKCHARTWFTEKQWHKFWGIKTSK